LRLRDVEAQLIGTSLDAGRRTEAQALAESSVSPIDDVRAPASYRRAVIGRLVAAFLREIGAS
jgi:CO/xanthine dehydrogenase FAD-binding subunit